ncbi:lipase family protein [Streptomyces sp. B1866]|uniref:lipase family protein n=1 Tax=Streptomyces sp. B1866 TaxID=3075431 RepID=UPI002890D64A|nr:lipase family protein [Streptomyces sp. B1866]MDT3396602.1 lipase family protein [Streptomyces sp. B1866]
MRRALPTVPAAVRAALALPVAAALALAGLTGSAAGTAPAPGSVPPDQDPFYAAPAGIGAYAPGAVVASRRITPKAGPAPDAVTAWQISYRTNDSHDRPELAVTTLLVPVAAWPGPGPRPVVSVQAAEDSTGTQCAPSYGVASGIGDAASNVNYATPFLDKGWTVAMPDFEGPKSVFMGGVQAGHAVLDGIRAVKNFNAARSGGVGAGGPWALSGYSGGAQATGWAAQLQPSYAPDVTLVGAAMGGTPADPAAVARWLDGGPFAGFQAAAIVSLDAEYPDAGLASYLNAQGRAALERARGKCLSELAGSDPFARLTDYTGLPDPLSLPPVAKVLKENTLGAAAPATPVYDYMAATDEIVPLWQAETLFRAWCAKGATIRKARDLVGEHVLEYYVRKNAAVDFLTDRFAGKPVRSSC